MDSRNSLLFLVPCILSCKNSIASLHSAATILSTRSRSDSSPLWRSAIPPSGSRLVDVDCRKTRLSMSRRSRCTSMLPVPLNSSKMTSSIRLPVSIRAVAMMVRLPPSSMFLAAPKTSSACEAHWNRHLRIGILPLGGTVLRPRESGDAVGESPRLCHVPLAAWLFQSPFLQLDMPCAAHRGRRNTSPSTDRCISVTSSGRSSIRRTVRMASLWLLAIALAVTQHHRFAVAARRRSSHAGGITGVNKSTIRVV